MKKIIVFCTVFLLCYTASFAQNVYSNYSNHNDQYIAHYYGQLIWGANGFRSVEEENRIMEQTLAELRRKRQLEEMTPEEIAAYKKRKDIKQEIRQDALEAKNQKKQAKSAN
jgi:hypothetical protein